ncbi:hypothetical protein Hanom_Chr10g00925801 [Helianthus anomalus]
MFDHQRYHHQIHVFFPHIKLIKVDFHPRLNVSTSPKCPTFTKLIKVARFPSQIKHF